MSAPLILALLTTALWIGVNTISSQQQSICTLQAIEVTAASMTYHLQCPTNPDDIGDVNLDPGMVVVDSLGRKTTLRQRIRDAWAQCAPDPKTPRFNRDHAEACLEHAIITGEDLP
jgi:hypothetical protein